MEAHKLALALMQAGVPNEEILRNEGDASALLAIAQRRGIVSSAEPAPPTGTSSSEAAGAAAPTPRSHEAAGGVYEGERNEAGQWEGRGNYRFVDGTTYEGEWLAGRFHGRGTMCYPSGAKYVGDWRAGQKHGTGQYFWADGRVELGFYERDASVAEGVMWSADMRSAWRIVDDGLEVAEISLAEAAAIAARIGEAMPPRTPRAGAPPT